MNLNNKLFKHIFAAIAVFATLATTGVTATVHATDSSTNPGISAEEMRQYFKEHGANQPNVNVITKVQPNKYGYSVEKSSNEPNASAVVYQFNKYPSQMDTTYSLNRNTPIKNNIYTRAGANDVYVEGVKLQLWKNGQFTLTQGGFNTAKQQKNLNEQAYFIQNHGMTHLPLKVVTAMSGRVKLLDNYNVYTNVSQFYRKFLHIDINKIMTRTQPANWKTKYAKGTTPKGFMKDGYSKAWLDKKLTWVMHNPDAANKEMLKIAKQVTLTDQSRTNATGKFDNATIR